MRHIYKQHSAGYACVVCGGFAATEQEVNHFQIGSVADTTRPANGDYITEASVPAPPEPTSVASPVIATVGHTVSSMAVTGDSLVDLRQNLNRLGTVDGSPRRTLRNMFDPTERVFLKA